MDWEITKDSRKLSKRPKYHFKGSSVKTGLNHELFRSKWATAKLTCFTCKGACIFSDFYEKRNKRKKYRDVFHPKYHRPLVEILQHHSLVPETGGYYQNSEDLLAELAFKKAEEGRVEDLGYNPEGSELCSRKQKAKIERRRKEEEEAKMASEEWIEGEFGGREMFDVLQLYHRRREIYHQKDTVWFSNWFKWNNPHQVDVKRASGYVVNPTKKNRIMMIGNRGKGYYKFSRGWGFYERKMCFHHQRKLKEIMETASKDIVLASEDHSADLEVALRNLLGC